jgi:methylation protein EvaC
VAANVMCHIPYLHSVVSGFEKLLKPAGTIIFEDPYLGDIVEKTSYDQIYDEHAFYFSVAALSYLFEEHGFQIVDLAPQTVHGGSMRYFVSCKGAKRPAASVEAQLAREERLGLRQASTYARLRENIEQSRDQLTALLRDLKRQGKRVVGYGATSKSTTVTNYCGLTSELVEFISDTTPIKQGKFSPGAHIPVRPHEEFKARYPEYALLFAWNHAEEIMVKEEQFRSGGGQWVVYVPRVQVVP